MAPDLDSEFLFFGENQGIHQNDLTLATNVFLQRFTRNFGEIKHSLCHIKIYNSSLIIMFSWRKPQRQTVIAQSHVFLFLLKIHISTYTKIF